MTATQDLHRLARLSTLARHWILRSTHQAGSGHPTSALSSVELMVDLLFGGQFRFDPDSPDHPGNDRLIFSKGHASPLLYSLWAAAGQITEEELMTYRQFGSTLEGHPTSRFRLAEAATGSLGQGLSVGVGMALNAKYLDEMPYRTYVLLGDSEMAEGAQWEAIQVAVHYRLDNLVGIVDVNRLGQRGETLYGHDIHAFSKRLEAFGCAVIEIEDGHDHGAVLDAYESVSQVSGRPAMIVARTVKGRGVSSLADQEGWHGKALDDSALTRAIAEVGKVDSSVRGELTRPDPDRPSPGMVAQVECFSYDKSQSVSTRDAFGRAIERLAPARTAMVVLDGEVCNSTRSQAFRDACPERFFEMYIAEQNMVGTALGLSLRGKLPFVSTFAAFFTRAFDQIRMACYSDASIKFVGSHAGVSVGEDGPSQMGLEDLAMFRTVLDSTVLYPCDAVSTERLVEAMAGHKGIDYLRTTRNATPVIYDNHEQFPIGGSKVLRRSALDEATVVAAGITVHEALTAYDHLLAEGTRVRVIDLYSVKPIDSATLREAGEDTGLVLTVEDHFAEGGLGEAVRSALGDRPVRVDTLAVRKRPMSGTPVELLDHMGISARAICDHVRTAVSEREAIGHE